MGLRPWREDAVELDPSALLSAPGATASQPKAAGFGGGGCVPLRMALMIASKWASWANNARAEARDARLAQPSRKGGGAGRMPILISCFCSAVSSVFCFFSGGGLASAKSTSRGGCSTGRSR